MIITLNSRIYLNKTTAGLYNFNKTSNRDLAEDKYQSLMYLINLVKFVNTLIIIILEN